MVAYLGSGIIPIQYEIFTDFGKLGQLFERFRHLVRLCAITSLLQRESIAAARNEEIRLSPDSEIAIMSDARHHCRKNSFHTDHVAIGLRSHRVVDIQHINRKDDHCTQRHEVVGFDRMYAVFDIHNIKVSHHIHDRNFSINKRLRERAQAINANDRWHCTKPIPRAVQNIEQYKGFGIIFMEK